MTSAKKSPQCAAQTHACEAATIRFAGDAGDGMQLAGAQFTLATALAGNDFRTLPDLPAEIRAPAGTLAGVAGMQIRFGKEAVHTTGDALDTLVAMNPAALQANFADLSPGGLLLVNADAFDSTAVHKAGFAANPLEDGSLRDFHVLALPLSQLNRQAVASLKLNPREVERCRNFFALGVVFWLYQRSLDPTLQWIGRKFAKNPAILEANTRTLRAGYQFGETQSLGPVRKIEGACRAPGRYRKLTGYEGLALGLVTAAQNAKLPLVFAGAPSQPATNVLHLLAEWKHHDFRLLQAEDDLAALCMALGASFAGALGAMATSGPGLSLSSEALGLAVATELPCVVVCIQRAGPSTGMPSKPEQADLLQALFGRHGEAPLVVLAPSSPADCFDTVYEAARLATRYMTPVIVLADLHLAQGGEAWKIAVPPELPPLTIEHARADNQGNGSSFAPFRRDARLARPWAIPGTPGLEHRLTGLEKEDDAGNVCYDPANHQKMVDARRRKVENVAQEIPALAVLGPDKGDLLVLGWGNTWGAIRSAVAAAQKRGRPIAAACLRHLWPLPKNTEEVLRRYRRVLVAELNNGQLLFVLRARFLIDAVGLNKVQGRPFLIREIEAKIEELLKSE
ncbi:MAG: 2-oxoacid:acceptor oxidoreductase subunit alpha [Gemmataceae bacterium]|nr:2-oxoacid:acceptor oxidoreductase subunit alpha [Gemmataceae bacterium]MCI0742231.1 2-oxoacid:acceptor oxidoreductase subunit alpha [Gemmataceae bacterium]